MQFLTVTNRYERKQINISSNDVYLSNRRYDMVRIKANPSRKFDTYLKEVTCHLILTPNISFGTFQCEDIFRYLSNE